jgi:hypothetical protein
VIHAGALLLLAKEETALQGATDRLIEIGGMFWNVSEGGGK